MKFEKPSISITEQIALLEARGMIFSDRARAAHSLQHISYYRLRAYWLPFEQAATTEDEHKFKPGTDFEEVLDLYIFDRRLRLLVMDAIERVEVSLRGSWAHHLAMKYGPHGYLDPSLYHRSDRYTQALTILIEDVKWSKDTFIDHYRHKYAEPVLPPIWMTAEIISLGQLSKWYSNLKARSDRQAVAKIYGIDEKLLVSFAHHLAYIRNICAHHGRLWNKKMTVKMIAPEYPASLKLATNRNTTERLYNTLAALEYFMRIVAPGSQWRHDIADFIIAHTNVDHATMGLPDGWQKLASWK